MEFFKIIDRQTTAEAIQASISPQQLDTLTDSMFPLGETGATFRAATFWGEFEVSYQHIKGGVRFSLLDCPNALTWTITTGYPPEKEQIVLHCTTNRTQLCHEFALEISDFLDEWEEGLTKCNFKPSK